MEQEIKNINLAYLNAISSDKDFKLRIFELFKNEVGILMQKMPLSLEKKDYKLLSEHAHKAKSSVSILGMEKLSEEMSILETDAKNLRNIGSFPVKVEMFLEICEAALKEISIIENNL
jgi:HPt (histidine-containing phosphotransfer) domain-containing protein